MSRGRCTSKRAAAGDAYAAKKTPGQQNTVDSDGKIAEKESTPSPVGSNCFEVTSIGDGGGNWDMTVLNYICPTFLSIFRCF